MTPPQKKQSPFELAACEGVGACSLAASARDWGELTGTVAHVHLGGSASDPTDYYCLSLQASDQYSIIGLSVMHQYVTIFDLANNQIGFAPQSLCH